MFHSVEVLLAPFNWGYSMIVRSSEALLYSILKVYATSAATPIIKGY